MLRCVDNCESPNAVLGNAARQCLAGSRRALTDVQMLPAQTCGSVTLAATSLLRRSYTCRAVVVTALGRMLVVTDAR